MEEDDEEFEEESDDELDEAGSAVLSDESGCDRDGIGVFDADNADDDDDNDNGDDDGDTSFALVIGAIRRWSDVSLLLRDASFTVSVIDDDERIRPIGCTINILIK